MNSRRKQQLRNFGLLAAILPVAAATVAPVPAFAATQVGVAAAVNTSAFGTAPGLSRKTKVLGDNVIYRERIETTASGLVQVLLVDGSTFTVGPNSNLVIDEFVYDPNTGQGKLVASLGKGVARFVGGKLSKNRQGVNVNTPVGTIGIRGGIANFDLTSGGGTFSLLFGEELTFTGPNGQTNRVYEAGYTLQVGSGGTNSSVRRTTQADLGGVQQGLSGKPGQNGGATQRPTETSVSESGFTQANSDLGVTNTLPTPKPDVVQSTDVTETDETLVQVNETTQNQTTDDVAEQVPSTPEPEVEMVQVRILQAGDTFTPSWDTSITVIDPGAQGILGGSDGIDENVTFSKGEVISGSASALYHAVVDGNPLYQFVFENSLGLYFYSQTYANNGDDVIQQAVTTSVPAAQTTLDPALGPISGFGRGVQVSNEDFVAFAHFPALSFDANGPVYDPDGANMILGLYGIGTDWSQFSKTEAQVREYSLSSDPLTTFVMGTETGGGGLDPLETDALFMNPLVAQLMGQSFMEDIISTELLMIQSTPSTLENSQVLASSFLIQGTGADQKSFISLAVGSIFDDNGTLTYDTGRRGSHRMAADETAGRYGGIVRTVSGPDGSNFFGPDAQSFLLGGGVEDEDPSGDGYILLPDTLDHTDTLSMSFHVGVLDTETPVSSFQRTQRTLSGFASGVFESSSNVSGGILEPKLFASSSVDDLSITFLPGSNTLTAEISVEDTLNSDDELRRYHFGFGRNSDGSGGSGRGTFIDNDTYAAREQRNTSAAYVVTDNDMTVTQPAGDNPNSYLIPSTLLPGADAAIFSGVNRCTCAFLEWGYWGASVQLNGSDAQANLANGERYDNMHLGTWVAGQATMSAELPTSGSASYAGHAVGSVVNNGAQYLAAGNFGMDVNFSTRNATASITNFDGRNFGSNLSEVSTSSGANMFNGVISDPNEVIRGEVNASIVSGPASAIDGVMGNFNIDDGTGWQATGIVAGQLQ